MPLIGKAKRNTRIEATDRALKGGRLVRAIAQGLRVSPESWMAVQRALGSTCTRGGKPRRMRRRGGAGYWVVTGMLLAAVLVAAAGIVTRLDAQSAPSGSAGTKSGGAAQPTLTTPDSAQTPTGAVAAMKKDLLRLVSANEVYFAKNKWYSEDVRSLRGYQPSPGVRVTILAADADGWSAEATSTLLPGKSCVLYVGPLKTLPKTQADGRSGSEAVAVCDRP